MRIRLWHVFVGASLFGLAVLWVAHRVVDAICQGVC